MASETVPHKGWGHGIKVEDCPTEGIRSFAKLLVFILFIIKSAGQNKLQKEKSAIQMIVVNLMIGVNLKQEVFYKTGLSNSTNDP